VIYIDIDFMDDYRVFTWNKERFPNPRKLTDDLREKGFKTVVIVDPAVKIDENYAAYRDVKTQGLAIKNADGTNFVGRVWAGKSVFPDFVNPKAREWFGEQYKGYIADGVDGFWNDMNEPANFPESNLTEPVSLNHPQRTLPLDARHTLENKIVRSTNMSKVYTDKTSGKQYTPLKTDDAGGTHARFHNVYGMLMAQSTFEGVRRLRPDTRPFVLTRAGFAGVQRYAAVWTGDNTASWEHLRLSVPMLLNLSVSGVPFVGADVGGYAGNPSGELYARWLQAASLTPFLRSHSEKGAANKEPWEYGDDFSRINRETVELRYQFLPYLYTLFYEHSRGGQPVMRPLWYEYAKDYRTYLIDDEYLVGRDLLVAPVMWEGARKRGVYFPAGDDWRDWLTGEIYKGGTWAEINAPLDKLPVFARVGAVIPTEPVIENTTEMPKSDLTLNVITGIAPDKTESAKIFQDAGDGFGYQNNKMREIGIEHRKGLLRLSYAGNFQGQKIRYIEVLGINKRPTEIRVDGKLAEAIDVDSDKNRVRIKIDDNVKEISLKP
jgi:alpha-glucosidase